MTTLEQNYLEFIKAITKYNDEPRIKRMISSFNKSLYKKLNVDITKIKLFRAYNLKNIKDFLKFTGLDNVYLLVALKEYRGFKIVLTDFNSKKRINSLGYYGHEKVTLQKYLKEEIPVFIVYAEKKDQEQISKLVQNRMQRKKSSYLDINSVLYRNKNRYGNKDKSGYISDINKIYKKFCEKFIIKNDINYLVDYILSKETKLHEIYKVARNTVLKNKPGNINVLGYSFPSFDYELSYMTTALYDLQNIDIKVRNYQNKEPEINPEEYRQYFENACKCEIERNFIKIIEKEQSFKTNINEFIQSNNR